MDSFYEKISYATTVKVAAGTSHKNYIPVAWHSSVEIVRVVSGVLQANINSMPYTLNPGDLLLISGGTLRAFNAKDAKEVTFNTLLFEASFFGREPEPKGGFLTPLIIRGGKADFFAEVFERVSEEIHASRHFHSEIVFHCIGILSACIERAKEAGEAEILPERDSEIMQAKHLLQFIKGHYHQKLTVEMGAKMMKYSKFYFCRYFKSLTDMTFLQYVISIRIDSAKRRLATGNEKISEIALECGFENIRNFNQVFKERVGMTPNEYRKERLGNKKSLA
jgi:AraC-like DNA-binding protein